MLKPEHLRTLQEVVRRGSFAAAANRLGYTASAVSQQIAALERETGVRLFQRTARSVVPTEAAEVMVRHSDAVLSQIDRLVVAVADVGRHTHRDVRIGVFPSPGTHVLPAVLARLTEEQRLAMRVELAEPSHLIRELGSAGDPGCRDRLPRWGSRACRGRQR
ncbi:LysR family transcriptional regulator [Nocardioides sp. B-3]|uniref:LysR family transcriptional regulator n=1 Tax=Nocardioides sp. B-3 TaxID=2895565 RepID=UPI0021533B33|nr:LysR family transcriptional regulator [Nocardioides sp. B-3]UUZ59703.1 LysR family transcriptional regulator [Nocardioides sp. B-3]